MSIEEAIAGIRQLREIVKIDEDYQTIVEAENAMANRMKERKQHTEEIREKLKALARVLDTARKSSTRPPTVPSAEQHAHTIYQLDATRLALAKEINDKEALLAVKEAELARMKTSARELDDPDRDPAREHSEALPGTAIRLSVIKGMGFEPVVDKQGSVHKMFIRSASGDVHCVDLQQDGSEDQLREQRETLWKISAA